MPCNRPIGCICEGGHHGCPNWTYDDLEAAYEQPAPDPNECPNCAGDGFTLAWRPDVEDDNAYQERIRCETCNPDVGEPRDEERRP